MHFLPLHIALINIHFCARVHGEQTGCAASRCIGNQWGRKNGDGGGTQSQIAEEIRETNKKQLKFKTKNGEVKENYMKLKI